MSDADKKKRWKLILNIVTVVALLALGYAIRHQILDTIDNLGKVNAWALLLMLPIELWNYDAYSRMYRYLFARLGDKVSYKDMFKVSLELTLVNHVFPSGGVSGFSYFSLRMKKLDVSPGKSTLVQTIKLVMLFVSFEALLLIGLLFLVLGGHVSNLTILVASSVATLLLVGTAGAAFLIGSETRINSFFTYATRAINRLIKIVRPKHPETINIAKTQQTFKELHQNYLLIKKDYKQLLPPLMFGFFANLTEVLAIYVVYIAFGHWVNPGAVILAYAVANFAGLISVLPGGVGVYEALMTAVLATAGVSPAISLPVTVMYRVVNMTIQIIPGYYFYHKSLHDSPTSISPAEG
ncbi:MAG: lysylphosphatidylglycerol synthase transmembrane domain-containing protein [Candidatus Saccharimonadales bacterium]